MFEVLDAGMARRGDGTTVEIVDEGVVYRRGERTVFVPLEYLLGERAVVIHAPSIRRWEVPHALEAIGSIEREEILSDLCAALTALGLKHRVE